MLQQAINSSSLNTVYNGFVNYIFLLFFSGAGDETRTRTVLPPRDFKSLVSAIPPHPHMARLEGLEPSTYGVEIRYSILIELQPHILVLAAGLEPARHGDTRFLVLRVCQFHHASISILQDLYQNNLQSVFTVSPIQKEDLQCQQQRIQKGEFYERKIGGEK